jgi:hypothetical protein
MRGRVIAIMATATCLAVPGVSEAARIGPNLHEQYGTALQTCTADPFCTLAQTKLAGDAMRAPFSGTITHWNMTEPNGSFWLQVLRKHGHGRYESLRSSDPTNVTSAAGEIKRFDTHLRIHRGDYVAIGADDFYASSFADFDGAAQGFCRKGFVPGLEDGDRSEPNPGYSGCGEILLYNVTLVH